MWRIIYWNKIFFFIFANLRSGTFTELHLFFIFLNFLFVSTDYVPRTIHSTSVGFAHWGWSKILSNCCSSYQIEKCCGQSLTWSFNSQVHGTQMATRSPAISFAKSNPQTKAKVCKTNVCSVVWNLWSTKCFAWWARSRAESFHLVELPFSLSIAILRTLVIESRCFRLLKSTSVWFVQQIFVRLYPFGGNYSSVFFKVFWRCPGGDLGCQHDIPF